MPVINPADMIPGESAMQYMLRQGMDPNDAAAALTTSMTGNGNTTSGNPDTAGAELGTQLVSKTRTRLADIAANKPALDWFGHNTNDPNSPYYTGPKPFGAVQNPLDPAFYGGYGANSISSQQRGNMSVPGVPNPYGTSPQSPYSGPFYAAARGDVPADYQYTYGPASTGVVNSATPVNHAMPGGQPGSGSTGFPSGGGGGGGGIVNGGTGGGYGGGGQGFPGGGVTPGSGQGNSGTGTTPPGSGMWNGNSVPSVGTPGQPGYIPGYNIAPNIVNTTNFANPNPGYNPNYNPAAGGNPMSNPDNPMNIADVNPQMGAVKQTGADAGTVQGQLDNILKNGNPLLEAARARAIASANARGLQNTSMASQAGEEAMVNAAMPIAQSDAAAFQNQNLVNQNITNQFLSQKEGSILNLQAAYQAFKQNNYGFDKNAQLQTYLSDSSISNQQKIAALQAAVSQANTATQVQGALAQAGLNANLQEQLQQMGFTQQNAVNLWNAGQQNLALYAQLINNAQLAQLEPDAKLNLINSINAFFTGVPMNGVKVTSGTVGTAPQPTTTTTTTTTPAANTTTQPNTNGA